MDVEDQSAVIHQGIDEQDRSQALSSGMNSPNVDASAEAETTSQKGGLDESTIIHSIIHHHEVSHLIRKLIQLHHDRNIDHNLASEELHQ